MLRHVRTICAVVTLVAGGCWTSDALAQTSRTAQRRAEDGSGPSDPRIFVQRSGRPLRRWPPQERRDTYQEPAYARGYSEGYERGLDDARDRDRYDPVGHKDYRSGDPGYSRSYGSRDAYKNNYRAGFRQGYEEGYRAGARGRR